MSITEQDFNCLIGQICERRLKTFNENDDNYPYCAFVRVSGFMLFSSAYKDQVRKQLEDEAQDTMVVSIGDITRKLAEMWAALGEEGKDLWNTKATQLRQPNP